MGKKIMNHVRFFSIIIVLISMALFSTVYRPQAVQGNLNIGSFKKEIKGWHFVEDIRLDYRIYTALDPDTLIFRNYVNDKNHFVNLAVVYHQNDRWGAHDPTVCYYSQGWKIITKPKLIKIPYNDKFLDIKRFVVKKGNIENLVYYNWFSSNKKLTPSRNKQMFDMVLKGIVHGYTESGFLRFSMTINPSKEQETVAELNDFVVEFTQEFLSRQ